MSVCQILNQLCFLWNILTGTSIVVLSKIQLSVFILCKHLKHRCCCRRLVGDLSIFYRYFHGHCSQKIRDIISVPLRRVRTTRSSTHSHPFQVSLPTTQTLSHKSSFIPRTCNLWNLLSSSCFPESYNLPSFKSKINKLDLISLSSQPFAFFFLPLLGLFIGHHSLSST